jgi:DNA (cytosine-5)-methyltransferase 1
MACANLVFAGPSCLGQSNLTNPTRRDDPGTGLFVPAVAIAIAPGAPAVGIENRPSVVLSHGDVVEIARLLFQHEGYAAAARVIGMDVSGGWQSRACCFMMAIKGDDAAALIATLALWTNAAGKRPVFKGKPLSSLGTVGDLVDVATGAVFDTAPIPDKKNAWRIACRFDNTEHDLPNAERPDGHKEGTTCKSVYGRMHADRPSLPITTGTGTPGQGRLIHPTPPRMITPHDAARLRGFPDGYGFLDGKDVSRKLLAKPTGDAVPPFLGAVASGLGLSQAPGRAFQPPCLVA